MALFSFSPRIASAIWLALAAVANAATLSTWDGTTGNWSQSTHWSTNPVFPNNNGPNTYDTQIAAGAVTLDENITINRLLLGGGIIEGGSSLTAAEGMAWTGGTVRGSGILNLGAAGPTTITGPAAALILNARTVNNAGSATFTAGTIRGGNGAVLNNQAGASFTVLNGANFFADSTSPTYALNNAGTFTARSTSGNGFTTVDAAFNNSGALRVENTGTSHTLSLAGGGMHSGTIDLATATQLELGGSTTLEAGTTITGAGTLVIAGQVAVSGGISPQNLRVAVGELNIGNQTVAVGASATQTGGTIRLGGGTVRVAGGAGALLLDDGRLTGSGTIDADLENFAAIAPGMGLGDLTVTGAVALRSPAQLEIELGGAGIGLFDRLLIGDSAELAGTLDVRLLNGFIPASGDTFTILTSVAPLIGFFGNAAVDGGRFALANAPGSFAIDYTPTSVVLFAYVPEPSAGLLTLLGLALAGILRPRKA